MTNQSSISTTVVTSPKKKQCILVQTAVILHPNVTSPASPKTKESSPELTSCVGHDSWDRINGLFVCQEDSFAWNGEALV